MFLQGEHVIERSSQQICVLLSSLLIAVQDARSTHKYDILRKLIDECPLIVLPRQCYHESCCLKTSACNDAPRGKDFWENRKITHMSMVKRLQFISLHNKCHETRQRTTNYNSCFFYSPHISILHAREYCHITGDFKVYELLLQFMSSFPFGKLGDEYFVRFIDRLYFTMWYQLRKGSIKSECIYNHIEKVSSLLIACMQLRPQSLKSIFNILKKLYTLYGAVFTIEIKMEIMAFQVIKHYGYTFHENTLLVVYNTICDKNKSTFYDFLVIFKKHLPVFTKMKKFLISHVPSENRKNLFNDLELHAIPKNQSRYKWSSE